MNIENIISDLALARIFTGLKKKLIDCAKVSEVEEFSVEKYLCFLPLQHDLILLNENKLLFFLKNKIVSNNLNSISCPSYTNKCVQVLIFSLNEVLCEAEFLVIKEITSSRNLSRFFEEVAEAFVLSGSEPKFELKDFKINRVNAGDEIILSYTGEAFIGANSLACLTFNREITLDNNMELWIPPWKHERLPKKIHATSGQFFRLSFNEKDALYLDELYCLGLKTSNQPTTTVNNILNFSSFNIEKNIETLVKNVELIGCFPHIPTNIKVSVEILNMLSISTGKNITLPTHVSFDLIHSLAEETSHALNFIDCSDYNQLPLHQPVVFIHHEKTQLFFLISKKRGYLLNSFTGEIKKTDISYFLNFENAFFIAAEQSNAKPVLEKKNLTHFLKMVFFSAYKKYDKAVKRYSILFLFFSSILQTSTNFLILFVIRSLLEIKNAMLTSQAYFWVLCALVLISGIITLLNSLIMLDLENKTYTWLSKHMYRESVINLEPPERFITKLNQLHETIKFLFLSITVTLPNIFMSFLLLMLVTTLSPVWLGPIICGIVLMLVNYYFSKKYQNSYRKLLNSFEVQTKYISEFVSTIVSIKSFLREKSVKIRFLQGARRAEVLSQNIEAIATVKTEINSVASILIKFFTVCIVVFTYGNDFGFSALIAVLLVTDRLLELLNTISNLPMDLAKFRVNIDGIHSAFKNSKNEKKCNKISVNETSMHVSLKNVGVAVDNFDILSDINLNIPTGTKLCVVGKNGHGKTTLLKVLCNEIKHYNGKIIGTLSKEHKDVIPWPNTSGEIYVSGQDFLSSGTILDNIVLADFIFDDHALQKVIDVFDLKNLIERVPGGLMYRIGEQHGLSSGEVQRIVLARCFYRNPKFVLLDEATSRIDLESEARILSRLFSEFPNSTIIMVSHRLSSTLSTDRVVVLELGKVIEDGRPHDLLDRKGPFYSLFRTQYS